MTDFDEQKFVQEFLNPFRQDIENIAQRRKITMTAVSFAEMRTLETELEAKFSEGLWGFWIQTSAFEPQIYDEDAWKWMREYFSGRECIFAIQIGLHTVAYQFNDGAQSFDVLNELHHPYHFYWTNRNADYMLFMDHNYVFTAFGQAIEWYTDLTNRFYNVIGLEPKPLTVTNIQVARWGRDLILDCQYDPSQENKPLKLTFQGCAIHWWSARDARNIVWNIDHIISEIDHIILFEEHNRKMAFINSGLFMLKFSYDEILVS